MKSSELRIGNYVNDEFGDTRKIISLNKESLEFEFQVVDLYGNIKPIPLTKDWLVKFGFTHFDTGMMSINKRFIIFSSDMTHYLTGVKIKYVHQLQNLYYALRETELILNK